MKLLFLKDIYLALITLDMIICMLFVIEYAVFNILRHKYLKNFYQKSY